MFYPRKFYKSASEEQLYIKLANIALMKLAEEISEEEFDALVKEAASPKELLQALKKRVFHPKQYAAEQLTALQEAEKLGRSADAVAKGAGFKIKEPENFSEKWQTIVNGGGYTNPMTKEIVIGSPNSLLTRAVSPLYGIFDGAGTRAVSHGVLKTHEASEAFHNVTPGGGIFMNTNNPFAKKITNFINGKHSKFLPKKRKHSLENYADTLNHIPYGMHNSPAVIADELMNVNNLSNKVVHNRWHKVRDDKEYKTLGGIIGKDLSVANPNPGLDVYSSMAHAKPNAVDDAYVNTIFGLQKEKLPVFNQALVQK